MTIDIKPSQLTITKKTKPKVAVTEASTIGLPPGAWPDKIRLAWNGATFTYEKTWPDGRRKYRHKSGATIVVLND